jgi:hypothetical protein
MQLVPREDEANDATDPGWRHWRYASYGRSQWRYASYGRWHWRYASGGRWRQSDSSPHAAPLVPLGSRFAGAALTLGVVATLAGFIPVILFIGWAMAPHVSPAP